jgi:hypothetical protein
VWVGRKRIRIISVDAPEATVSLNGDFIDPAKRAVWDWRLREFDFNESVLHMLRSNEKKISCGYWDKSKSVVKGRGRPVVPQPSATLPQPTTSVTLSRPVSLSTSAGVITLPAGMRPPVVSGTTTTLRVQYGAQVFDIPVSATGAAH